MKKEMWSFWNQRPLLLRTPQEVIEERNQITVNAVFDGIDTLEMKDLEDIKSIVDKRIKFLSIDPKELEENNIMW